MDTWTFPLELAQQLRVNRPDNMILKELSHENDR